MLARWNDYGFRGLDRSFAELRREMDRMFDSPLFVVPAGRGATGWPQVDVEETETGLTVSADVPGFKPEEVRVSLDKGVLRIEAAHAEEAEVEGGGKTSRRASFSRAWTLPFEVDPATVTASLEHGVLTLTLPRAAAPEPRRIEIKAPTS